MSKRKLNSHIAYHHFERIYTLYVGRIYNFVLKITRGNSYLAEEITQMVFVKLWERIDNFVEETDLLKLKSYLFTIARNTLLNYLKHETLEHIYLSTLKDTSSIEDYSSDDAILTSFLNEYVEETDLLKLKSYLFTIARNTLLNYLKHETLEHIYLSTLKDTSSIEDYSSDDAILTSFLNEYVQTLINELPPMRQKVFRLSRLQYLTIPEVASELGIAESTVENHLTLALKFMRAELKRRYKL